MAGTTTKGLRYPTASDTPAIHTDFLNLATDVDTELNDYALLASPVFTGNPTVPTGVIFEGATADGFETSLVVVDPTADRTITLPNVTGTVVTTGDTGTVSAGMLAETYQTTAAASTAATAAQDFARATGLMLGGM
jgi:hypothetical protein